MLKLFEFYLQKLVLLFAFFLFYGVKWCVQFFGRPHFLISRIILKTAGQWKAQYLPIDFRICIAKKAHNYEHVEIMFRKAAI